MRYDMEGRRQCYKTLPFVCRLRKNKHETKCMNNIDTTHMLPDNTNLRFPNHYATVSSICFVSNYLVTFGMLAVVEKVLVNELSLQMFEQILFVQFKIAVSLNLRTVKYNGVTASRT